MDRSVIEGCSLEKKKTTMDGNRRDYSLADDKNYSVPGQYSLSDYIDM